MNVGMLACYDQAKEVCAKLLNDPMSDGPSRSTKLLSSAVAVCGSASVCDVTSFDDPSHFFSFSTQGFTAALFSLPFDLIKSRLMNQRPDHLTGEFPYKGVIDASVKVFKQEGPLGFFNGFSAYYGRCAPHAMIILLSIESITAFYQKTMY